MALVTSACAPLPRHLCEVVVCTRGEFTARSALLCALAVSALLSTTAGVSVWCGDAGVVCDGEMWHTHVLHVVRVWQGCLCVLCACRRERCDVPVPVSYR